jgi:hypothetical protein
MTAIPESQGPPAAELVRWTFRLAHDTARDTVVVDEHGAVRYQCLTPDAGPSPEFGWWDGQLQMSELDPLRQLVEQSAPSVETLPALPAAGTWWVAMLSVCADAATTPSLVLGLEATVPDPHSGYPLLTVSAVGRHDVGLVLDKGSPDDDAAFVTSNLETLGYVGSDLNIPAGTGAFASLSRVAGEGDVLTIQLQPRSLSFNRPLMDA